MIFVDRNKVSPPSILFSKQVTEELKLLESLSGKSPSHINQVRTTFKAAPPHEIRNSLTKLFHGKCAYCESPSTGGAFLHDIDYFRPRRLTRQQGTNEIHYAWLAYSWDNLLLACATCNRPRRHGEFVFGKGNSFPVTGPRAPTFSSVNECRALEQGTLLDPCFDKPEEHLIYSSDGTCKALTDRGQISIRLLHLNRPELLHERSLIYKAISKLPTKTLTKKIFDQNSSLHTAILAMISPQAPYAGAARFYLEQIINTHKLPLQTVYYSDRAEIKYNTAPEYRDSPTPIHIERIGTFAPLQSDPTKSAKVKVPTYTLERLSNIEISHFKSLDKIEIALPLSPKGESSRASALMILGENAVGKSSILEALSLALIGTKNIERLGLNGLDFLHRDPTWNKTNNSAKIVLVFDNDESKKITLSIDKKTGKFRGSEEQQAVFLAYGPRRFFKSTTRSRTALDASDRVRTLFDPMAILPNPEHWLINASENDYASAIRALRLLMLLPETSFISRPARGKRKGQSLFFELEGRNTPLQQLSEGYRTIMATAVDIMRELLNFWPNLEEAQGIVLIDELETHLHPRWKMRLISRLREAMPKVQFICTTHDPLCLRGLYDGEVVVLKKNQHATTEQVADLPDVQGLTVEQLLTSDFFGLLSTEDPEVDEQLIRYAELANMQLRDESQEQELVGIRASIREKIKIGQTPQSQLVYEMANEVIAQANKSENINADDDENQLVNKMLTLWNALDREEH